MDNYVKLVKKKIDEFLNESPSDEEINRILNPEECTIPHIYTCGNCNIKYIQSYNIIPIKCDCGKYYCHNCKNMNTSHDPYYIAICCKYMRCCNICCKTENHKKV